LPTVTVPRARWRWIEVWESRTSCPTATSAAVATPAADDPFTDPLRYTLGGLGVWPLCESYETDERAGALGAFYSSGAG
jgi:hypothetical protein